MIADMPIGVAPGVDVRVLSLSREELAEGDAVLVVAEWRTEPRSHLWVTMATFAPITRCAICGEEAQMRVSLEGEATPADEAFWHADGTLHLVPSEHLVQRRLQEMGL